MQQKTLTRQVIIYEELCPYLGNPHFMFKKLPWPSSPLPCLFQVLFPKQSAFVTTIKEKIAVDKTFGLKNKNKSKASGTSASDVTTICSAH